MKKDIILAGVGGQGIISIAAIIGLAAVEKNMYIKQSEVHGMSQRGGEVMSTLRISDKYIYSDLIPYGGADIIIGLEPMESLRYLPYLKQDGWIISNADPFVNIPNYPDINVIYNEIKKIKTHILIPANKLAKELNSDKVVNTIILGATFPYLGFTKEEILRAIEQMFSSKGKDIVDLNIMAFTKGYEYALKYQNP
ncbi:MAG: indolepyruvate oxidoreductase subunit beta [Bacteroidales bacterium]|nr:indolepyruvate oxidoreductase subunit beta [Bacteroidales bacterium]